MTAGTDTLSSRIIRAILIITTATVVLCASLAAWALYDSMGEKEYRELRNASLLIEQGLSQAKNPTAYLSSLGTVEIRVTWIAADGTVLYDSVISDTSLLDNHGDRQEVIEAFARGEGQSNRYSDTLSEVNYYYALLLDDGTVLRLSASHNSVLVFFNRLMVPSLLIVVFLVLAAVLLAQWIARRTLSPFENINLDDPSANEMYVELQPLLARIKEQNEQIVQKAQEAETLRQAFVSNVSHELKTPLTVISGYAELLKNDMVKPEDMEQISTLIYEEAGFMRMLVDDILTLSVLDEYTSTNNTTSHAVLVDMASISTEALARLTPFAEQREVTTELKCQGDVHVLGIEKILTSVVYNLCENAIRYNRPGGSMSLLIEGNDNEVVLRATDTGIGLAPEQQHRVFERFYRVDDAHSRETGGTGLGLAIVKNGALYHNASVTLESTLGEGTTITIIFPR